METNIIYNQKVIKNLITSNQWGKFLNVSIINANPEERYLPFMIRRDEYFEDLLKDLINSLNEEEIYSLRFQMSTFILKSNRRHDVSIINYIKILNVFESMYEKGLENYFSYTKSFILNNIPALDEFYGWKEFEQKNYLYYISEFSIRFFIQFKDFATVFFTDLYAILFSPNGILFNLKKHEYLTNYLNDEIDTFRILYHYYIIRKKNIVTLSQNPEIFDRLSELGVISLSNKTIKDPKPILHTLKGINYVA